MKLTIAAVAVIATLMAGIALFGGGSPSAQAGAPATITRAPTGHPICGDTGDSGDDSGDSEQGDTGNDDDPSDVTPPPTIPSSTPDSVDSIDGAGGDSGGRDWDGFDHDIETDDCSINLLNCTPQGGSTGTDGVYMFDLPNYQGYCAFWSQETIFTGSDGPDFTNDIFSSFALIGVPGIHICYDSLYQSYCQDFFGNDPDLSNDGPLDNNLSSFYFLSPVSVPDPTVVVNDGNDPPVVSSTAPADANCDGAVGPGDALSVVLFVSGAGNGCTGTSGAGDANCSGSVDAVDAAQILRQAAGLASAVC